MIYVLVIALSSWANPVCDRADNLFEGGQSYLCDSNSYGETCIKVGYHRTVELDGVRIFSLDDSVDRIDRMIFDEPVWHRCNLAIFGACTHQSMDIDDDQVIAYRYKGPDVWDARINESEFSLNLDSMTATLRTKGWGPDGDLRFDKARNLLQLPLNERVPGRVSVSSAALLMTAISLESHPEIRGSSDRTHRCSLRIVTISLTHIGVLNDDRST